MNDSVFIKGGRYDLQGFADLSKELLKRIPDVALIPENPAEIEAGFLLVGTRGDIVAWSPCANSDNDIPVREALQGNHPEVREYVANMWRLYQHYKTQTT